MSAGREGFEPTHCGLTVRCSTAELPSHEYVVAAVSAAASVFRWVGVMRYMAVLSLPSRV